MSAAHELRIVVVGEGMLELSRCEGDAWQLRFGGDTLNTAIHLARLGCSVSFASALGTDAFSLRLRNAWEREGLDCDLVLDDPSRGAGLYAISLDESGERSFTYWRDRSAARRMFELADSDRLVSGIGTCDCLYFSLITLAILPAESRAVLLDIAREVQDRGGTIAFDGNFRPQLWQSPEEAADWRDRAIALADIGLPTLDDERLLAGHGDAESVAAHWSRQGCKEVVIKTGAQGCLLPDSKQCPPQIVLFPIDTSGAGDAFNAGYLERRLAGGGPREAAEFGHELAAWTIQRAGAVPPADARLPR